MKVLTSASILLLPGGLLAGLMGMNVTFKASVFLNSSILGFSLVAIVLIALITLIAARIRRWI
jgi:Mg2+ and Co2+ transporter CorA